MYNLKRTSKEITDDPEQATSHFYREITPTREVTRDSFSNSIIKFDFEIDSRTWFVPAFSFLRMRCSLLSNRNMGGVFQPLKVSDGIGPAVNLMANLFQSMNFSINGKDVSVMSQFVAQITSLDSRKCQSLAWLKSVGASLNFSGMSLDERINAVSVDGTQIAVQEVLSYADLYTTDLALGYVLPARTRLLPDATTVALIRNVVDVIANPSSYGSITLVSPNPLPLANFLALIDVGDIITYGDTLTPVHVKSAIRSVVQGGNANTIILTIDSPVIILVAGALPINAVASTISFQRRKNTMRKGYFEVCWTPPLSIFKIEHALPCGIYSLQMMPHARSVYKNQVVQTKTKNLLDADFNFNVELFNFQAYQTQAARVEDIVYYIELHNTRCQATEMNNNSFSQKTFDVNPGTTALTVAYQDGRVLTDASLSASEFKLQSNAERTLNRFNIEFANQSKPSPDGAPTYSATVNYTTQLYLRGLIESGQYQSAEGGSESLNEWLEKGAYYYFEWRRDGDDRSTKVVVHQSFDSPINDNCNLLLFDHSRSIVEVVISNGEVASVKVQDL